MAETCPPVHTWPDTDCRYGGAYYHGIIRALWAQQLKEWRVCFGPAYCIWNDNLLDWPHGHHTTR